MLRSFCDVCGQPLLHAGYDFERRFTSLMGPGVAKGLVVQVLISGSRPDETHCCPINAGIASGCIWKRSSTPWSIGCSNYDTNRAFVLSIEAARLLAGGGNAIAVKLLKLAIRQIGDDDD